MASIYDVARCFDTYLNTYGTANNIRISFPGRAFTPSEGETFLDPFFLPARPYQQELIGPNSRTRAEGIYQISITTKAGTGMNSIYTQYEGLQEVFNRGTALTYTNGDSETILVEINRFYMGALDEGSSPYMFVPINIEWRCDLWVGSV